MKIDVIDGLPFTSVRLTFRGQSATLERVLVDTGSAGTILAIDQVKKLNILPEPEDEIYQVIGIGGSEYVFSKQVDALIIGDLELRNFAVEFGAMRYGIELDGIAGMDFLMQTGAILDLAALEIRAG